jgi:endonuclease/exonuclease/phosphatase (EEP) superfamily protein YafD
MAIHHTLVIPPRVVPLQLLRNGCLLLLGAVLSLFSPAQAQTNLRVMCWNIMEGEGAGGLDALAAEINRQNPDLVLLNEARDYYAVWGPNQTEVLAQKTGMPHFTLLHTVATGITGHKAVSVLSRFPLGQTIDRRVMYNGEPTAFATLETSVVLNGIRHRILSTRFAPQNSYQHELENAAGISQATQLMRGRDESVPVIFGGDFNARFNSYSMQQFMANSRLNNVAVESPDAGQFDSNPIDFVFYRGPWRVVSHRQRFPSPNPSDHPWIVVDFAYVPATTACVNLKAQIASLEREVANLRASINYYDPRDPYDREMIDQINAEIREKEAQISSLRSQWTAGCSYPTWYHEPIGSLDGVSATGLVHGWTLDPDRPAQTAQVHLYIDGPYPTGTYLGSFPANQPRPDVNQATGYPGNHGYTYQIPAQYADGRTHAIYAYGIDLSNNPNKLLGGSPKSYFVSVNRTLAVSVVSNSYTNTTENITVTARDAVTGAPLSGTVFTSKGGQAATGAPFTYTYAKAVQICDYEIKPPCYYEYFPEPVTFTVNVPNYDSYSFTRTGPPYSGGRVAADAERRAFEAQVRVYPNPAVGGFFHVEIPGLSGKASLVLQNVAGKTVYTNEVGTARSQVVGSFLPKGAYVLLIRANGKLATKKVMIQ